MTTYILRLGTNTGGLLGPDCVPVDGDYQGGAFGFNEAAA